MTNLFDFLRWIKSEVEHHGFHNKNFALTISEEQYAWLQQFLHPSDMELHFKGRRVGGTDDNPVVAQDYLIAGDQVDIFSLLTEAMMQNPTFADLVQGAAKFFQDHVPNCQHCKDAVLQHAMQPSWEFTPHPVKDNREFPCPSCETGELEADGFTQPNGQSDYTCNVCGHKTSYP